MKLKRFIAGFLSVIMILSLVMQYQTLSVFAVTSDQIKENTNYVIVSKKSGKAMTVEGSSTENGALICQKAVGNYESQVWNFEKTDDGYYIIVNKKSGKVLDVPNSSTDAGTKIEQYDKNSGDNQKWSVTDVGDGYCRITPKSASDYALNVQGNTDDEGAYIIQWGYSGADNEKWEIREVPEVVAGGDWNTTSPDGNTSLSIYLEDNGSLTYSVIQEGQLIVENSDLGINTSVTDFRKNLKYKSVSEKTINETYSMLSGKKSEYTNNCIEKTITFTSTSVSGVEFDVVTRAYNDGVALRYVIRTGDNREITIEPNNENTSFKLPAGSTLWYMNRTEADFMYEGNYSESSIDTLSSEAQPTFPMLYKTGEKYALVTEADKRGTYVGSLLRNQGDRTLKTIFDLVQTSAVKTTAPFTSPWRTVIVGDEEAIINNTMVENLSPAADTSYNFEEWVEPGVSSWSWVSYYGGQEDPEIHKNFIDLAANMGWTYYILDEQWQPGSNTSGSHYEGMWDWFEEVRDYANDKGVKLIAWVNKTDVDTDAEREARFKEWSEAGIVGIKVDFFYNETQEMLQLHDDIYADAAKYKLLVNIHGSNPTSGEIRTYPNVIAREAIRGQEQGGITAEQYTLIPFIRAAIGTADVTEQLYSRDTSKTSMGFQIALSTLVENGIRSMGGKPGDYYGVPAAMSYYKNFPAKWDDLHLINADVGSYINIARKTGDSWYAAGISVDARNMTYNLDFLDEGKTYTAIIYKEAEGKRDNLEMEVQNGVTSNTNLSISVQSGGGYAVKLIPTDGEQLQSISVSQTSMKIQQSYSAEMKIAFAPSDTKLTDVIWTVEDSSIAKVDATVDGAVVKGLKEGKTKVTVTSAYDESIKCVIPIEITPGLFVFDADKWTVLNDNGNYLITGENSVSITTENGVIDKNVFAMKVPEGDTDFEITAKISGEFSENYQGGFIGVFNPDSLANNYVSVGRRYHTMFNTGGDNPNNHFAMMSGSGTEFYAQDANVSQTAYVRLVKQGNTFTGYYRFNENDAWTQVTSGDTSNITNANLAASDNLYVGFYAGSGGSNSATSVKIEDFTYNGNKVNVASYDKDGELTTLSLEGENAILTGGAVAVEASACSNGYYAGFIGGENNGTLTFDVNSGAAGGCILKVYHTAAEERKLSVMVNGEEVKVFTCPQTGAWEIPATEPMETVIILKEGTNVIQLAGAEGGYAPNVDKIELTLLEEKAEPVVEINGYQISTALEGFRAVYSVSDPSDGVESVGMVYGLADYVTNEDMVVGSENTTVFEYEATETGKMESSVSELESADSYTMTMKFNTKNPAFFSTDISVRAYAKLKDGTYIYSDVESTSVYDIADSLYTGRSMNTIEAHNYLYNNILTLVNPDYKEVDFNWSGTVVGA